MRRGYGCERHQQMFADGNVTAEPSLALPLVPLTKTAKRNGCAVS
jgi:hypothetical protein